MGGVSLLILLFSVSAFILGSLVLFRNKRRSNGWFVVFCFISSVVVFIDYVFRLQPRLDVVVWAYAIGAFMPIAGIFWSFDLKKIKIHLFFKVLLWIPAFVFFYLALTNGIISDVYYLTLLGYKGEAGHYFRAFSIYVTFYNLLLLFNLFFIKKEAVLYERAKINYAIIGLLCYGAITGIASLILPAYFNIYDFTAIDAFGSFVFIGFTVYAITRYRLMDIKSIISKSSIFAILVLIVSLSFVFLSDIIAGTLSEYANIESMWVSGLLVGLLITILFNPLKNLLERLTDKFLFIKTYKPSEVLAEINNATISEINLAALLSTVSQKLHNAFFYKKIAFFLLDEKGKLQIVKQEGFDIKYMEAFAKGKEKVLPIYFSGNKNIWVIPELKTAYDSGEYQPKSLELLMGLYDMDVNLVIPLFVKDDVIGIVLIGDKKSDDLYTQDDINTLSAIAGQLAMAIENARLYEKQKRFNQDLKVEVKKATEKLVAANKELQRLDDAKSEFLSIASHQLRTPTTIIRGYISMMQEGSFGPVPPIIQDNLKKVNSATDRLLSLIESLLDISRMEAGRLEFDMQATDLAAIAKGLIDDFKKKAEDKKLKLDFYFPKDLPKVSADPNKVKEVASNLIDNSIKYTPKGEVSVGLHQEGASVVFSVQDTGLGVEPEDLPRLFNKFVRGKDMVRVHTEGTGLGLYFARVVIENMGGRIWAESPGKNQGSKFCFSLPLADKGKAKKVSTK